MIDRKEILGVLEGYNLDDLRIGMVASHSALDTADGAVEENFRTLAVCQEGREKPYVKYFRANRVNDKIVSGMIDEVMLLKKFSHILKQENQDALGDQKCPLRAQQVLHLLLWHRCSRGSVHAAAPGVQKPAAVRGEGR